jgi:hypothetical protein
MGRKYLLAAVCAAAIAGAGANAALAGEITGNGRSLEPLHAKSICAFSGQNDDPLGLDPENGPPGRTQSYGQDVRSGALDPTDKATELRPGFLCNPNNLALK